MNPTPLHNHIFKNNWPRPNRGPRFHPYYYCSYQNYYLTCITSNWCETKLSFTSVNHPNSSETLKIVKCGFEINLMFSSRKEVKCLEIVALTKMVTMATYIRDPIFQFKHVLCTTGISVRTIVVPDLPPTPWKTHQKAWFRASHICRRHTALFGNKTYHSTSCGHRSC